MFRNKIIFLLTENKFRKIAIGKFSYFLVQCTVLSLAKLTMLNGRNNILLLTFEANNTNLNTYQQTSKQETADQNAAALTLVVNITTHHACLHCLLLVSFQRAKVLILNMRHIILLHPSRPEPHERSRAVPVNRGAISRRRVHVVETAARVAVERAS